MFSHILWPCTHEPRVNSLTTYECTCANSYRSIKNNEGTAISFNCLLLNETFSSNSRKVRTADFGSLECEVGWYSDIRNISFFFLSRKKEGRRILEEF